MSERIIVILSVQGVNYSIISYLFHVLTDKEPVLHNHNSTVGAGIASTSSWLNIFFSLVLRSCR
ncbi:MAG: hypothetical protein QOK79_05720, partial [Nitrososphaeraceae archaeon]|nr:hypothetical protein [Nitrososphaeraceae archaeon]